MRRRAFCDGALALLAAMASRTAQAQAPSQRLG